MSGYIYGIIGTAAVIGTLESLLPRSGKTRPYVRLVAALCLLCVIARPLGDFLSSLSGWLEEDLTSLTPDGAGRTQYEEILAGEVESVVRDELAEAVKDALATRFSVESCEVGVALRKEDGTLFVTRVVVTLMGRDVFRDPYAIEAYVSELLGCECITVIG